MICDELDMSRLKRGVAMLSTQQRAADEIDRLRAENARQRAWIDGVMAQATIATYYTTINHAQFFAEKSPFGSIPIPLITRPAPFEDK